MPLNHQRASGIFQQIDPPLFKKSSRRLAIAKKNPEKIIKKCYRSQKMEQRNKVNRQALTKCRFPTPGTDHMAFPNTGNRPDGLSQQHWALTNFVVWGLTSRRNYKFYTIRYLLHCCMDVKLDRLVLMRSICCKAL